MSQARTILSSFRRTCSKLAWDSPPRQRSGRRDRLSLRPTPEPMVPTAQLLLPLEPHVGWDIFGCHKWDIFSCHRHSLDQNRAKPSI